MKPTELRHKMLILGRDANLIARYCFGLKGRTARQKKKQRALFCSKLVRRQVIKSQLGGEFKKVNAEVVVDLLKFRTALTNAVTACKNFSAIVTASDK